MQSLIMIIKICRNINLSNVISVREKKRGEVFIPDYPNISKGFLMKADG